MKDTKRHQFYGKSIVEMLAESELREEFNKSTEHSGSNNYKPLRIKKKVGGYLVIHNLP